MTRYLGGLITKDESLVLPANNYGDTSAPGVWTLEEAQALNKQGLWPTAGVSDPAKSVENIFSVDTYVGNSGTQTITNGIDISGEGGLVWIKSRSDSNHSQLYDTVRGSGKPLYSSLSNGEGTNTDFASFTSTGFTLGYTSANGGVNGNSSDEYVAWTFRKASKFFDVVTYTGDNSGSARDIAHSLGATPGMIILKRYNDSGYGWMVWHRSLSDGYSLSLNSTDGQGNSGGVPIFSNNDQQTSTHFQVPATNGNVNYFNATNIKYVAYLFGHDTSSDGMIQCGTYTASSSGVSINLGFEPQFLIKKRINSAYSWYMMDTLRGFTVSGGGTSADPKTLKPDAADGEGSLNAYRVTSTGFYWGSDAGEGSDQYIYMAIRKGPMATPTSRASVFEAAYGTGASQALPNYRTTFPIDMAIHSGGLDSDGSGANAVQTRLTGLNFGLQTNNDNVENNYTIASERMDYTNGFNYDAGSGTTNQAAMWRRAPGFFDVVTYEGTGSARTLNHNLGVAPEMIWCKSRETVSSSNDWLVYHKNLPTPNDDSFTVNGVGDIGTGNGTLLWNSTAPTSTVFSLGTYNGLNQSGKDYIAFLWATLAGISKVGSFSHTNGSSTDVDCGFSSGSRWIMVRRIDSGINNDAKFYVWNGLTGIVSGNDSYFQLNNNDAIVSNTDYIDTLNSGFQMSSSFITGDYIFYAIAA